MNIMHASEEQQQFLQATSDVSHGKQSTTESACLIFYRRDIPAKGSIDLWNHRQQATDIVDYNDFNGHGLSAFDCIRLETFDGYIVRAPFYLLSCMSDCFRASIATLRQVKESMACEMDEFVITLPDNVDGNSLEKIGKYVRGELVAVECGTPGELDRFLEVAKFLGIRGLKDFQIVYQDEDSSDDRITKFVKIFPNDHYHFINTTLSTHTISNSDEHNSKVNEREEGESNSSMHASLLHSPSQPEMLQILEIHDNERQENTDNHQDATSDCEFHCNFIAQSPDYNDCNKYYQYNENSPSKDAINYNSFCNFNSSNSMHPLLPPIFPNYSSPASSPLKHSMKQTNMPTNKPFKSSVNKKMKKQKQKQHQERHQVKTSFTSLKFSSSFSSSTFTSISNIPIDANSVSPSSHSLTHSAYNAVYSTSKSSFSSSCTYSDDIWKVRAQGRKPQPGSPMITEDFRAGDRYQCKVCMRKYQWKKSLVRHYRDFHPGQVQVVPNHQILIPISK